MSPYTRFAAGALFPLHERLKHHDSVQRRRELERTQWLDPAALDALRVQRLRSFLIQAGRSVPYWRRLFAERRFDPAAVSSLADLRALPLLTKADIRANVDAMKRDGAERLARYNTGGSSGEPLVFYMGMDRVSHDVAAKWRATRWWGVDIGDPEIVIWGSPVELGAQDRLRRWRDGLLRSTLLPAFEMSEANLDGFVAAIRQRRPAMLFGYPSALALIAQHARRRGVALNDVGIRVAFVTSERLYDHQRESIREVFGCPVANGYGGRDAGFIAHECPAGGMHVSAEDIVVELLDSDGHPVPDGEAGEIVTTHAATGDFPFIRYRTGDVAVMSQRPCPCGRGLPTIQEIQGRSTDFVVAADGSLMHGLALIYILRDMPELQAFKIVQQSRQLTTVYAVAGGSLEQSRAQAAIVQGFRRRLGADVDVALEWVAQIPPEKSGKFRYVVSHAVVT
jgi:phenylacetate-coenzyme A ligase PaaK-like adenylate-forming protein